MKILFSKLGEEYTTTNLNLQQSLRLLSSQLPSVKKHLQDNIFYIAKEGRVLIPNTAFLPSDYGATEDTIELMPCVEFAGAVAGIFSAITGAVSSGASLFLGGGAIAGIKLSTIALVGTAVAVTGIARMLSHVPTTDNAQKATNDNSFFFNGAENIAKQGEPIPIVYGQFGVGSLVVSLSIKSEDL